MARALLLAQAPAQHSGGAYRDMINQVVPAGQPKIVFSFSSILQRPPPSHHHHQRGSFQVLTKQHCSLQKKVSAILLRKVAVEVQTTERRKGICSVADVAEQGVQTDHKDVLVHQTHSQSFQNIHSESELLRGIRNEVESGRLPARAGSGMLELYTNYKDAVRSSGVNNADDIAVEVMSTVLDRILLQFENPFTFPSYHQRMLEPYDYYEFGQNYVRPLIDYRNSYLGNIGVFDEIEGYLKRGENVILLSNHQTEADPAVIALLLETTHPFLAENLTYVAGDRVVLDPFCKPFSMGRNLLCVYSKKHLYDIPALAEMKRIANTRTLREMSALLRNGGQLIWIAPSGGRDRPDPVTQEWVPAPFDTSSVMSAKRLSDSVRVPGHIYPTALLCFNIMPPPYQVEKELGERRAVGYSGVGFAVGPEICYDSLTSSIKDKNTARDLYTQAAWEVVNANYNVLKGAICNGMGLSTSTPSCSLVQPWRKGIIEPT
ncbi:unnamed protein product [Sphagnum tenellum]